MLERFKRILFKQKREVPSDLKETGECIKVNTENIEISPVNYTEEVEQGGALEIRMLDALSGKKRMENIAINACYLVYNHKTEDGKERRLISSIIHKDKSTLSFLLLNQGEINIYLESKDSDKYFFDLEFLER
ncbi:MAG TPA: hypothetical protein VM802_24470 [Chitinophaga sp.]|uniref:hypothetical protein n=1 Tax=Chitinophaga sp. TaxID=1869181 RepID=UPI002CBB4825|nr:hypothetical protein [Chitinophaga sp.]HVI48045.1 hypothetical protein [Chitinophaga sp.]